MSDFLSGLKFANEFVREGLELIKLRCLFQRDEHQRDSQYTKHGHNHCNKSTEVWFAIKVSESNSSYRDSSQPNDIEEVIIVLKPILTNVNNRKSEVVSPFKYPDRVSRDQPYPYQKAPQEPERTLLKKAPHHERSAHPYFIQVTYLPRVCIRPFSEVADNPED